MAFKIPRLTQGYKNQEGLLERYWDDAMGQLEGVLNEILALPAIQTALTDLDTATTAAQTAADNANSAAAASTAESSIVNSYIDSTSFTAPLMSCDTSGNATIKTHDRVYGDGTTVEVTGATYASGESASSVIRIYYDQSSRAGGAVTFEHTLDPAAPPVQGGDRHSVGALTVPGAGTSNGNYITPPGYIEP